MAFLNVSLLLGGLLVGVPILLHLLLRQQPRQLVFPAIRFVQQRRETNQRTLRLRHWLLLLLRCLALLLLALALARPSVASAAAGDWLIVMAVGGLAVLIVLLTAASMISGRERWVSLGLGLLSAALLVVTAFLAVQAARHDPPLAVGNRRGAVAAVLVFDTSPRMEYREANQSRLEQAQELASWLLEQLPPDSEVAVAQSHPAALGFSIDLAAALRTVQRLQPTGVPRPLPQVLEDAIRLAGESRLPRKEIYVFTDRTEAAWADDRGGQLARELAEQPDLLLYVIDVGSERPRNLELAPPELSEQRLAAGSELRIRSDLRSVGTEGERAVSLWLEEPDPSRPMILDGVPLLPEARQRGRQVCRIPPDGSQGIEFRLRGLSPGTHQGRLEIEGEDGLAIDDVRYFTVQVEQAWPVLVAAPEQVNADNFIEALAPYEQRVTGQARYVCQLVRPAELPSRISEETRVVCLLDPPPLPPSTWEALARFVRQGGGLAIFLGSEATQKGAFNEPAAGQLLPGPLGRQWRAPDRDLFLAPRSYDHPVLAEFRPIASQVPWNQFPVLRHWSFEPLAAEARVVLHYGNGQPALVETSLGQGRVLTMTTPISEKARPVGRLPWNELTGPNDWPRFVLINEIVRYLVDTQGRPLNYQTGETVRLANDPQRHPDRYQLFAPPREVREVVAREGQIQVLGTEVPGAYRLKGNRGETVIRGFAVNLPEESSDLQRCEPRRLDQVLGSGRYRLARHRQEIEVGVGAARQGHEFFPTLLILLAVVLGVEQLLANRFYRKSNQESPAR